MLGQTYPTTLPAGTPTWAIGLVVVIGALGGLVGGLVVLLPMLAKLFESVRNSAEAKATAGVNSDRIGRQSERMNRIESDQKTIALHTPAPSQPPDNPLLPKAAHEPPTLNRQ